MFSLEISTSCSLTPILDDWLLVFFSLVTGSQEVDFIGNILFLKKGLMLTPPYSPCMTAQEKTIQSISSEKNKNEAQRIKKQPHLRLLIMHNPPLALMVQR